MKPSEEIAVIIKHLVKKETKKENPFANWEQLEDLEMMKAQFDMTGYMLVAILKWLDQKFSTPPSEEDNE